MPEENRTALANYRLERAAGELASSRDNLDAGRYAESLSFGHLGHARALIYARVLKNTARR